jgi:NAD(P)-dependent dehydrogenase (short-subunit alcohol dehydrogenase family)
MTDPILVTGCSSGIGQATALRLAGAGHTVYATARSTERLAECEDAGCQVLALDVTDEGSVRAAVATVEAQHGAVGTLVNNAGYGQGGAIEAVPIDLIRAQFETNVFGYVRCAQVVLPGMRQRGSGRIVNVSSVAGTVVMPGNGVYSASKFAIESLSEAMRFELRSFGIQVVVVAPGPIRSEFTASASDGFPQADGGPYDAFHAAVVKADAEADQSSMAGDPQDVAKVIQRAIEAKRPKPRYTVTTIARVLPKVRGALPERAWEAFLRTQATPPAPADD